MKAQSISLERTGHFSKMFLDYISQDKILSPFYKYPLSLDSFKNTLKDISSQKFNRKLLVDVITEQYVKANPPAGRAGIQYPISNIQYLLKENTFTVCTGHQLCLFTGPLYFIYKIISTINLAEALKKMYPDNNFVPVYWMATEDHDFEEVNHINLFGKKITWDKKQGGAVGNYSTNGIGELIEELKPVLGDSENAKSLLLLLQNAYLKHTNLSQATRYIVNELFGEYGLLILDPNDARLKAEFSSIMEDDMLHTTSLKLVNDTIAQLEKYGYKVQVNPRDINLFYNIENQRERIVKENELFNVQNTPLKFDKSGLLSELKQHPERFSPNVVMRPLYQQKILPNLAYIGGPGEIVYWLEYKAMFEHYGIFFPALVPRNFVMILEAPVSEKITKLRLAPEDIFLPINELNAKHIASVSGDISLEEEKKQLEKLFETMGVKLTQVDATLAAAAKSELQKNIKSIEELEKKMLRSVKQKNETAIGQIEKIKSKLFPDGSLQERHDNFIPFYLKHGKQFVPFLKENLNPMDFRFTIFSEV